MKILLLIIITLTLVGCKEEVPKELMCDEVILDEKVYYKNCKHRYTFDIKNNCHDGENGEFVKKELCL